MTTPRTRRALVAVLTVVCLACAGGIAYAATRGTPQTLHACSNSHGTLRLLQHGRCPDGYAKVSLNRQGPRGLPGPPGPGVSTIRGASDTSTTSFQDHAIAGMGLTAEVVCNAGSVGTSSSFYLTDTDGSTSYTVNGSYDLTAPGAHAALVYDGGAHPNLSTGQGLIELTQPAGSGTSSEIVLQYDSGGGGQLTADVVATRSGAQVVVHVVLYESASHCVAQAEVTPVG